MRKKYDIPEYEIEMFYVSAILTISDPNSLDNGNDNDLDDGFDF